MNDIDQVKVEHALEEVCQSGCGRVRELIDEIRQGNWPQNALQLNSDERKLFLQELESVMKAYQGACKTH